MKNTVKQIAAGTFIAFLLLAGNVKSEGTEIKSTVMEVIETSLQLESWMTDETVWNITPVNLADYAPEKEKFLEIESWMSSDNTWSLNFNVETETEVELELECWMKGEITLNLQESEVEAELELESWMFDNKVWN